MHRLRLGRLALTLIAATALALAWTQTAALDTARQQSAEAEGQWFYLSDLEWEDATTGWLGVANQQIPALDHAFHGGQLRLGETTYEKGIGVYPLSEITYRLDGLYQLFISEIGLDVRSQGATRVRFLVFVDGALRYESPLMGTDASPLHVEVSLTGARTMRLVVDAPSGQGEYAFADWADALVQQAAETGAVSPTPTASPRARGRVTPQPVLRQLDEDALRARGRKIAAALPASLRQTRSKQERPAGLYDRASGKAWLSTGRIAVGVSMASASYATLTVLDMETQRPVLLDASGSVTLGKVYTFNADLRSFGRQPLVFQTVDDPIAGPGNRIELHTETRDRRWRIDLRLTLFANDVILYEISIPGAAGAEQPPTFQHVSFESSKVSLLVEEDAEYLTDFSRLRYGHLYDDGIVRREAVGEGKPLFIWSARRQRGLLMAMLDRTYGPTYFQAQVQPGRAQARWGLSSGAAVQPEDAEGARSARLYLEVTKTADVRFAFGNLRAMLDEVAPEAPLPDWFKYQWLSWYIYGMSNDAEAVQRQADYIAQNLADLGPWNLLIDAGWYVSEGKPNSGWRTVDESKFPGGMRSIVDSVHEAGSKVILYLSAPYIDSMVADGHWLGLSGIINEHPDWLRLLGSDDQHQSYAFNFGNPDVLDYWSLVMDDFFVQYGVDGIKIDGVGNAEGAILSPEKLDDFGLVENVNEETMDIYQFFYQAATSRRADAYIETGWLTPTFARPYVHTFRYGDEAPFFSSPYPFPGLVEHVDYAIIQKAILGLRPNMGAIFDNPNTSALNRWWLQAGLALGVHVTMGFDLAGMTEQTLSAYRSLLAQYEPFVGTTTYGRGLKPQTFATTRQGTTYLGVLNRSRSERRIVAPLAEHGLDLDRPATAYDVESDRFISLAAPFTVTLPAQSFRLYIVRQDPGVLWTNSSFSVEQAEHGMTVTLKGPAGLPGFVHLFTPRPSRVLLDGHPMVYSYDEASAVLSADYQNEPAGHIMTIEY
jgi:hypothetical protein